MVGQWKMARTDPGCIAGIALFGFPHHQQKFVFGNIWDIPRFILY